MKMYVDVSARCGSRLTVRGISARLIRACGRCGGRCPPSVWQRQGKHGEASRQSGR